jgi:hypothetical protein
LKHCRKRIFSDGKDNECDMHQTKYEYRSPKFAEWPWLFVAVPIAQMVFMFWIWAKS